MTALVTRLENGLTVATDRVATVESVSVGVWVGVGARDEPAQINGVAHLLEHMAFKGTTTRSAIRIAEEIEAVGGHLNAWTSRENTAFYARILKEDTGLALDILSDILQRSILDPEELERERAVVLQEIGQAIDTPDDIVFDQFQEAAYPSQAVGRPVLGTAETVGAMTRDVLDGFLRRRYTADRMVLVASGQVEHERILDEAARLFGGLERGSAPPQEVAIYRGGACREERDLEQLHLVLGFPGVSYHDEDFYTVSVLSTLLGGGMSSRLFQEIREKRGLVYSIYSYTSSFRDSGVLGIYAGTGEAEAADLVPVLGDEILRLASTVTDTEVARAKAQLKASLLMGLESTMSRAEQIAQQILVFGRPLPTSEIVEKLERVDRARVAVAAERMVSGVPTLAALGPGKGLAALDGLFDRLHAA